MLGLNESSSTHENKKYGTQKNLWHSPNSSFVFIDLELQNCQSIQTAMTVFQIISKKKPTHSLLYFSKQFSEFTTLKKIHVVIRTLMLIIFLASVPSWLLIVIVPWALVAGSYTWLQLGLTVPIAIIWLVKQASTCLPTYLPTEHFTSSHCLSKCRTW